ncbi:MAG TPA: DUF1345 domain-containing protein [Streptosporangiaceae bacterium]
MTVASAGLRVACAMLIGAVTGAIVSLFTVPTASILFGWNVAVAIYLAWTWSAVWRLDPGPTARLAKREDPSIAVAEFLLIGAGVAALVAVAFALVKADQAAGGTKAYLIAVGLLSVVLSWTVVHTVFMLRYARAYYAEPAGGIEFNELENHVLNPVVMSRTVKVNPLLVLVSILIGSSIGDWVGGYFGCFVAALLSIPCAAALQVIVKEIWQATAPGGLLDDGQPDQPE